MSKILIIEIEFPKEIINVQYFSEIIKAPKHYIWINIIYHNLINLLIK